MVTHVQHVTDLCTCHVLTPIPAERDGNGCNAHRREHPSHCPCLFHSMPGEAPQLDEAAPRPPFTIPSPVPLTESEEDEQPHSAQDPNAQPCGNSDNAAEATISIPIVQAVMAETAGRELLHPANTAELGEEDDVDNVEEAGNESESEHIDGHRKRRSRGAADKIRRPRMHWSILETLNRTEHSDEEIQIRLNDIARTVYEKAGTAYPPGLLI